MADLMLKRAKQLLKSAEELYKMEDLHGVAGLAYQAFECAVIALNRSKNGKDIPSHQYRRKRAEEKIASCKNKLDFLWEARNIDFYGNANPNEELKELSKEQIKECLAIVTSIIEEIEEMLDK